MQSKGWKNFLFAVLLTTNGAIPVCTNVDKAWAKNSDMESPRIPSPPKNVALKVTSLASTHPDQRCKQLRPYANDHQSLDLGGAKLANIDESQPFLTADNNISSFKQIDIVRFDKRESCSDRFLSSDNSLQLLVSDLAVETAKASTDCENNLCKKSIDLTSVQLQRLTNSIQLGQATTQANPQTSNPQPSTTTPETPRDLEKQNDPPPLEVQPGTFPNPSPGQIEQLLETPEIDYSERLETLRRILQQQTQSSPSTSNPELGLRVRPRTVPQAPPLEQQPPTPIEKPVVQFRPIGYLQARVGYFYSSNIFSANIDPIEDSLIFYGLTLASTYFPLGSKTYINGSIDGNQIRYIDQSIYNYNQLRFNLSLYRQLSQRMYGEIAWSNQLLFYTNNGDYFKAGDRFLNENSIRLSLGRRDPLNSRLFLDSFYELSINFADPENRSRIINSLWLSLSYYLQKPLQVGVNYQFNLSNFTNRPDSRDDEFHRLFGHLSYRVSNYSNLNVQGGVTFGGSNAPNINFDGWFFGLNYSWDLGQF
ncbi:hypothetical protein BV372_33155 [Nostoc sp. T09]|uniref:hypothetical protein n=1 Tax=Nostoc sp. T09 TaxID=1932621 RepID=UPI000A369928|nr:hypothetical protein [Nostoc sp. T09]OUL20341.1 hypothetical protein BV372_33155 [Nostoc sp. T09]